MKDYSNNKAEQFACRWCGGKVIFGTGPANKPHWKRYKCKKCGSISYVDLPKQAELDSVYLTAWAAPQAEGAFASGSTTGCISSSLLDAINWDGIDKHCLDYGAGNGAMTREIASRGGKVVAVEPFGQALILGRPGQVLWIKSLDDIPNEMLFEWIFLVEVIEHMLDPISEISKLHDLLLPGGKLFVTTPNAKGWRARKDGFLWREAQNATHISLFTEASLSLCLASAGFSKSRRLRKPVNYGKKGFSRLALAISQIAGIDGGLRYVATK